MKSTLVTRTVELLSRAYPTGIDDPAASTTGES